MNDPDLDESPACSVARHDDCVYIANPLSPRRDWRPCGCACHLPPF